MKVSPEYRRFADPDSLAHALVETVTRQLRASLAQGRSASLVVPGGRTPVPFFRQLSQAPLQWDRVYVTLTDERWVDVDDAASNERLLREHLLQNAAARAQLLGLRGAAARPERCCRGQCRRRPGLAAPGVSSSVPLMSWSWAWERTDTSRRCFRAIRLPLRGLDLTQPPGCIAVHATAAPAQRVSLNLPALLQTQQLVLLVTG